jgi:hypothetical protein
MGSQGLTGRHAQPIAAQQVPHRQPGRVRGGLLRVAFQVAQLEQPGVASLVSSRRARLLAGPPSSTKFCHSMIQLSGRVSVGPGPKPSWPLRAVKVNAIRGRRGRCPARHWY